MLLQGILPPITTPFYPEGDVYHKKLEANVERYSRTPVAGIVVLGSTGEAILLSDEERRQVLKTARDAAASHKVLIAGTGIESEWILQIAPANVPTLISTWFGRKPSASPHATFALAVEVHRLLSAQGFRDFRWEWDGWAIHGSPEPVAPDSTR